MSDAADIQEVLDFWFGTLTDGLAADAVRRGWFESSPERDEEIRRRFGPALERAAGGGLGSWLDTARGSLAFILVCDQFSRQIHRGEAGAFATDPLALGAAETLVERGSDRTLALDERVFVYLPFEHAESRLHQHASVGLFSALRDETPPGQRHLTGAFLRHAQQHRDIVLRFGRFPHRNRALGRASTPEELAFLETAGDFGQRR